ncbi:MAG: DNA/RNA non-specific endonuclease [Ruminococcus sp.]|nr:DNA/RNA non-specific endonuclease [Ruminococcus sp.]
MKKFTAVLLVILSVILSSCSSGSTGSKPNIDLGGIPEYKSSPYVEINGNSPEFTDKEKQKTKSFEKYSRLDKLGRCGTAFANVSTDTMPKEKRGSISSVHPTGWVQKEYAFISDGHIYNRCHLIGYQLTGENANKRNLITGTRYMNVEGMLPFEEKVAQYVHTTRNHVLYRVTPIFKGDNLLASGVEMEAWSVEDGGKGVSFNVYCYNVQPGVMITYSNGNNKSDGTVTRYYSGKSALKGNKSKALTYSKKSEGKYILNKNSKKFHLPSCAGVKSMSSNNKAVFKGKRSELIKKGYDPCGICNP